MAMFTKACCSEVNSSFASSSVSAAMMFTPSMTWGLSRYSDGSNFAL